MVDAPAAQRKVYHISPPRQWLGPGIFIVLAIIVLLFAGDDSNDPGSSHAFLVTGMVLSMCAVMIHADDS